MTPRIEARELSFAYDRPVLAGVDVGVPAGSCLALLGANGAGKTTLLRLLAGIEPPAAGTTLLDGTPVVELEPAARARRIGYLPQGSPQATGFAVYEMVLMGLYPLLPAHGWESRREWRAVARALRRVGAAPLLRRPFDHLSGGEQRRVLLARSLVTRPDVLLLDEPLAALDPGFALDFLATLRELLTDGVTVVVSTHRLGLARELADRVLVLHQGRTLATGAPEECLTPAVLDAAYDTERFSAGVAEPVLAGST